MRRPACVVVLAAGEGTRMRSSRPKPLHQLCGREMVVHVLDAATHDDVRARVVVVGHGATQVEKVVRERVAGGPPLVFVEQAEQLGTGHAVAVALPAIAEQVGGTDGDVLILPGDTPLLRAGTLDQLLEHHRSVGASLTILSAIVDDPSGYGRVVRERDGSLARIVEERDASDDERALREVNTAIMVVREGLLGPALRRVGRHNAQNEYYLTDLVAELHDAGHRTEAMVVDDAQETAGVNDRAQLAAAESALRRRINERWMLRGVTMFDPDSTYVDVDVTLAADVCLLPGTVLRGRCVIERGARVGPHAVLTDTRVGEGAFLASVSAERAVVGADARVGAYAVLAPGSRVAEGEVVAAHSLVTR
ncbi:MAG: bifunctional UDP-N-acetylglucosamine diphosphorylase/glucosamine-1-phosphate N-acetyltransferase GlmU [Acidimicrobiales bacterium]